jgi:Chondroitinase B
VVLKVSLFLFPDKFKNYKGFSKGMTITINEENRNTKKLEKEISSERVVLDGLTNYTVDGVTFSFNGEDDTLELQNCVECKIINCTFRDRDKKGNFIHIRGPKSKGNRIEHCTFKNHTFEGENGGEAIIIGLDKWTGFSFKTSVLNCEFNNCRGDPELVSIKSCHNELRNNKVISTDEEKDGKPLARGNFAVRNGGYNIIQENVFEGAGGIRILGRKNEIRGNYHKNNGHPDFRPLAMENGNVEDDENFKDGKPSEEEITTPDTYARAKENIIEDNIYEDNEGICVVWGKADRNKKPQKNIFRNNILIGVEKESRFLRALNGAELDDDNGNTFEKNKRFGEKAERADMPEDAVEKLPKKPEFKIPAAGLHAS